MKLKTEKHYRKLLKQPSISKKKINKIDNLHARLTKKEIAQIVNIRNKTAVIAADSEEFKRIRKYYTYLYPQKWTTFIKMNSSTKI